MVKMQKFIIIFLLLWMSPGYGLDGFHGIPSLLAKENSQDVWKNFPRGGKFVKEVTNEELDNLLENFTWAFESGKIDLFLVLFAKDIRTEEYKGQKALRKEYAELFLSTDFRSMKFNKVRWREETKGAVWGDIQFVLKLKRKMTGNTDTLLGALRIKVVKLENHLVIQEMYHAYNKPNEGF
jgi:hypothetical protein